METTAIRAADVALIALDMDGTLLNSRHETTAYTRARRCGARRNRAGRWPSPRGAACPS